MELVSLKLKNFRSYDNLEIKFSPKYNVIYGNNGEGKTNLVEAIYILAITKSFRVNSDKLMIKKGEKSLSVEGRIKTNLKTKYKINIDESNKEVLIDGNKQDKLSDYISKINVILFNPEDVNLINDAPTERRKLLNIELSKIYKEYLILLNVYNKILKHRNSYLREVYTNKNISYEYLDVLTNQLVSNGLKIYDYRKSFINKINDYIGNIYKDIFSHGDLVVKYQSEYNNKNLDELLNIYQHNYKKELEIGKTLIGIHHDDLIFYLDKNKLKDFGSVGQHKNSIISFKLAEIEIIKELSGEYPILILDDLFSELDEKKIKNIMKLIDKDMQIFITSPIKKNYIKNKTGKVFKIVKGKIVEENNGK